MKKKEKKIDVDVAGVVDEAVEAEETKPEEELTEAPPEEKQTEEKAETEEKQAEETQTEEKAEVEEKEKVKQKSKGIAVWLVIALLLITNLAYLGVMQYVIKPRYDSTIAQYEEIIAKQNARLSTISAEYEEREAEMKTQIDELTEIQEKQETMYDDAQALLEKYGEE